jgi:hypothetical protein
MAMIPMEQIGSVEGTSNNVTISAANVTAWSRNAIKDNSCNVKYIYLSFTVASGQTVPANTKLGTLPSGFEPVHSMNVPIIKDGAAMASLVFTAGSQDIYLSQTALSGGVHWVSSVYF